MQYSRETEIEGYKALPPYKRTLKVLLCPQVNKTQNVSLGMTILEPGNSSSAHKHSVEEELWFVVSGTGLATVGAETIKISQGTAIYVPPGQVHQLVNNGSEQMQVLWTFSPPGPESAYVGRKGGKS
jgi:mannose-6-phosphate isomerase-like protein (cupin superfamily)